VALGLAAVLRRLPALAALALVLVLGWRVAGWAWVLVPDSPPPAVADAVPAAPDAALARHWFGVAAAEANVPVAGQAGNVPPLPAAGPIALRGLIAGGAQPLAILDVSGTAWQVQVGERFAERYMLVEIGRDGLVIDDNGQRRVLQLPVASLDALASPDAITQAPAPPGAGGQAAVAAPAVAPAGAFVGQSTDPRAVPRPVGPGAAAQGIRRP
jgi:hypothetical protein